jgi:hypothetical protein
MQRTANPALKEQSPKKYSQRLSVSARVPFGALHSLKIAGNQRGPALPVAIIGFAVAGGTA